MKKPKPIVRRRKVVKKGWNYRVIKMKDHKLKGRPQSYHFAIYSVYYTDDKPLSWSATPMHPIGDSLNEFIGDFSLMRHAFDRPILKLKDGKLVPLRAKKK